MFALRRLFILTLMLAACVASDEVNILVLDKTETGEMFEKVENLLLTSSFHEIKSDRGSDSIQQSEHFVNANYLNVFVRYSQRRSLNIKIAVAGRGDFSDSQINEIRNLLILFRGNFGHQNVIADAYTKSGQKI